MGKINIDINELKRLYINEHKSTHEIAKIFGCSNSTIRDRLLENNIELRDSRAKSDKKVILDNDEIRRLYLEENKSIYAIAKQFNCEKGSIKTRIVKMGIQIKDSGKHRDDLDNDEIKRMYVEEKMSTHEIARVLKCDHSTIRKRLNNMGVTIMSNIRVDLDNDEIVRLYTDKHLSTWDIAKIYNCSYETIRLRLINMGVQLRTDSNERKPDTLSIKEEQKFRNECKSKLDIMPSEIDYNNALKEVNIEEASESIIELIKEHDILKEKILRHYVKYMSMLIKYSKDTSALTNIIKNEVLQ